MSSNSDFLIETYQSDNSQNFFPNTIESNSSSWINNVKQMWVDFIHLKLEKVNQCFL